MNGLTQDQLNQAMQAILDQGLLASGGGTDAQLQPIWQKQYINYGGSYPQYPAWLPEIQNAMNARYNPKPEAQPTQPDNGLSLIDQMKTLFGSGNPYVK